MNAAAAPLNLGHHGGPVAVHVEALITAMDDQLGIAAVNGHAIRMLALRADDTP